MGAKTNPKEICKMATNSNNPQNLPDLATAKNVATQIWDKSQTINGHIIWQDLWHNSTPTQGLRVIRFRSYHPQYVQGLPDYETKLATTIASAKQILGNSLPPQSYKIYQHSKRTCIKIWYKSSK
jgi:hypothetical protein